MAQFRATLQPVLNKSAESGNADASAIKSMDAITMDDMVLFDRMVGMARQLAVCTDAVAATELFARFKDGMRELKIVKTSISTDGEGNRLLEDQYDQNRYMFYSFLGNRFGGLSGEIDLFEGENDLQMVRTEAAQLISSLQ